LRAAAIIINGRADSTGVGGDTGSLALTVDVAAGSSFGFSTETVTVGPGSSATFESSAFVPDSVASTVRAVGVPVFFFFFGFGSGAGLVSLESVDASAFSSAGCLLCDDEVDDDSDPDVVDGAADATP
jgi:hypothetical protein